VFFLRKRRRRQQHPEESHVAEHEPKRRDNYPQPNLPDTILHFAPKNNSYIDGGTKFPANSLDSGLDQSRRRTRSSRASSSIFILDDTMTVTSRSNYLRPVSLGEPIALKGLQAAYGAKGQMPTLAENPVQPTMERQPSHVMPATPKITLGRANSLDDDEKTLSEFSHISTSTRPKTPESVAPSPAQLPPLAPVPPMRYSFLGGTSKRDSNNTLAPSRHDVRSMDDRSRPQSMLSVYSTRTQKTETVDMSATLSPDMFAVLSRLKKRISTPWSITSAETYRAERMSVTRASEEA
jgi:hypothetical protein